METLILIDKFLQNVIVRWALLAVAAGLVVYSFILFSQLTTTQIALKIEKASNAEYVAAAKIADAQRTELENKIEKATSDIKKINADYSARIEKLTKNRITATDCAGMVAESVRLLQEGEE